MMKKVIAWLLIIATTAAITVGGTLAYLTDRDSEANVFTTGDVKIDLEEDFDQGSELLPGEDVNKDVQIRNEGPNAAWVWYTYAIPQQLDGVLDLIYANEVQVSSVEELQDALYIDNARIVLTEDLVVDANTEFKITAGSGVHFECRYADVVLDLNDHKITVTEDAVMKDKSAATGLFAVRNGSLTVIGDGNIEIRNKAIAFYGWSKSELNIYGNVNVDSNSHARKESVVYSNGDSTVHVYGGTYSGYGINTHDKNANAYLVVHAGVTFGAEYKNLFDADMNAGRISLAEGCEIVEKQIDGETWYSVVSASSENPSISANGSANGNWVDGQFVGTMVENGITYNVYSRLYKTVLQPGEVTTVDLSGVKLPEYVDITPDGDLYKVEAGETTDLEWNVNDNEHVIYVSAYAIQTEGFDTVEAAYEAYQTQWGEAGEEYSAPPKLATTIEDIQAVCKTGGKVILANDIIVDANTKPMTGDILCLINGKNVTLDLNGYNLIIEEDAKQLGSSFFIGNPGGHLNIVGDGGITVKNGIVPVVWVLQSGTANIYGGTFTSNSASNEAMFYSQSNGGVINIYGGTYVYDLSGRLNGGFNVSDSAGAELRIILHEGVLLSRPEYSQHQHGGYGSEASRIQLEEGCVVEPVEIDGVTWYQVVKK